MESPRALCRPNMEACEPTAGVIQKEGRATDQPLDLTITLNKGFQSLARSFNKYLLNTYSRPDSTLSAPDAKVNMTQCCPQELNETDETAIAEPKPPTHPMRGRSLLVQDVGLPCLHDLKTSTLPWLIFFSTSISLVLIAGKFRTCAMEPVHSLMAS